MVDKVALSIEGEDYWIEGGDFEDMLELVRAVDRRSYDSDEKIWIVPGSPQQVARLVAPYRLMHIDDDPVGDSTPTRIPP
jgi:hypothetical protein